MYTSITKKERGVIFLKNYQQSDVLTTIRCAKLLEIKAIQTIAHEFYTYIVCNSDNTTNLKRKSFNILILHSPSSTFALGKKKEDPLALILIEMKRMDRNHIFDISPHLIMINRKQRLEQHKKNRQERIEGSRGRFRMISRKAERFLQKYHTIYILDDVATTGSTLQEIQRLVSGSTPDSEVFTLSYCH